jgi:hypothetical protein
MTEGKFGFVTTLIGTQPDATKFFGCGGLSGGDDVNDGSQANSGPTFVKSITKTANNGEFLVTLQDGYRAVWDLRAELWSPTAGPHDGKWAGVCLPANQGAGHETPITFLVTVLDATNTPAELNGRTISISISLKDSAAGA